MKRIAITLISAPVLLGGCDDSYSDPAPMPADPLTQQLAGKTLVNETTEIQLQEGNRLVGRTGPDSQVEIAGAWQIRAGRFCRTLTAPEPLAGTECQGVSIDGETVTFDTSRGEQTFIITDS